MNAQLTSPVVDPVRSKWLADRRKGIGGSDIAAICGLSPYATPVQVFLEKTGQKEDKPFNAAMRWGIKLEPLVAQEYSERTGHRVQRVNKMLVHPKHPWALANIDRGVINPQVSGTVRWTGERLTTDRILECKTSNQYMAKLWGDDADSDKVPDYYMAQCQWYLGITGTDYCDLAVLIGGSDYRQFELKRDDELFALMLGHAEAFWRKHVLENVPPPPVSEADVVALWPRSKEKKTVIVGPSVASACHELAALKLEMDLLKEKEAKLKTEVKTAFQDAEAITHGGQVLATWKSSSSTRLDSKLVKQKHPAVYEECSNISESRTLLLKAMPPSAVF